MFVRLTIIILLTAYIIEIPLACYILDRTELGYKKNYDKDDDDDDYYADRGGFY